MATRTYPRNGLAFTEPELAQQLDAALGLMGCTTKATETTIEVTHPALGAPAMMAPCWRVLNLQNAVPTLRQWATDADTASAQLAPLVKLDAEAATLAIYNADGSIRLTTTVPRVPGP